jgi:non-specific serine/threonine protein kinase
MGIDIDTLALAVVKQWGLNEDVIHMVRRLPLDRPVRAADSDADLLRAAASCGNEIVDVVSRLAAAQQAAAMSNIANRYHRLLGVSARDLADALQEARELLRSGVSPAREASTSVRAPTSDAPPVQPPSARPEAPTPPTTTPSGNADKPLSALRSRATAASSNLRQP